MRVWLVQLLMLAVLSACSTDVDLGMQPRSLEFSERIRADYSRIRPLVTAGKIDEADAALKALSTPQELVVRPFLAVGEAREGRESVARALLDRGKAPIGSPHIYRLAYAGVSLIANDPARALTDIGDPTEQSMALTVVSARLTMAAAYIAMDRFADAADQVNQARRLRTIRIYDIALIQYFVAMRLGHPDPALLRSALQASAAGWPDTIVRMVLGEVSPDVAFAQAADRQARVPSIFGARPAWCLVRVNTAVAAEARGDHAAAREGYVEVQQQCERGSSERIIAEAALRALTR